MQTTPPLSVLRDYLESMPEGPLADLEHAKTLLASAWSELDGSTDSSMADYKVDRATSLVWKPPELVFRVERHGGTVQGSTRAEVQEWTIDVNAGKATCQIVGFKQLTTRAPGLDTKPIARTLADAIHSGRNHPALNWSDDRRQVKVLVGQVVPDEGFGDTVSSRRKRLREQLEPLLKEHGWAKHGAPWRYRREND